MPYVVHLQVNLYCHTTYKLLQTSEILHSIQGALYEYTESESLEKWVNEQAELVQEESEKYLRLQKQNIEEAIYYYFSITHTV